MRLIDADAVMEILYLDPGIADFQLEMIQNLPTADVVPLAHGRWIQADLAKDCIVCSVCKNRGYKDRMAWRPDYAKRYFNYCPNCGAHMEGAEDARRNE